MKVPVLVPSTESRRLTTNGFILIVARCIQSTCNEQCVEAAGSRSPAKTERARIAISVMVCP